METLYEVSRFFVNNTMVVLKMLRFTQLVKKFLIIYRTP